MNYSPESHIDYENQLNPAQLEAVTTTHGPALVIAGAGSGKTRTIVYRVAWLVEQGIDASSILLLTFTRKSAEEMLNRAAMLLDRRVSRVSGGTFHSTGNIILRRYATLLGYDSSFSIMDQGDMHDVIDQVKKSLNPPAPNPKSFPKARTISAIMSHSRGTGRAMEETIEARFSHLAQYAEDIERIRTGYEAHKKANNMMDYDDLLALTIELLEENPVVRDEVAGRWKYILVDEYQDTNHLQATMLRLIATGHDNVTAVGDDSQSIYSFRGGDFRNIMEFPNLFPGATIIKLEENYRSTQPILAVTNRIIAEATTGYPKKLFTRVEEGPLPLVSQPQTERDQSRFVVKCLDELQRADVPLRDVAVLFRAGFHSFDLEGELARNGISFVKYGGFKFVESVHIKDVLSHLKVVGNPKDRLSWARILKLLPGVGPKTASTWANKLAEQGAPEDPTKFAPAGKKYTSGLIELLTLINEIRSSAGPLSEKVDRINRHYFPHLKENYDNYPKRMRDLEQLADLTLPYTSLNRFLSDMTLEPPDEDGAARVTSRDTLVLSTIHSAKGLEWHTVILIWASEGRIPSPMAEDSPDEIEEERRLIYVATTRAKHNLVIISPMTLLDRRIGIVPVRPSRFFDSIPSDLFRTVRL